MNSTKPLNKKVSSNIKNPLEIDNARGKSSFSDLLFGGPAQKPRNEHGDFSQYYGREKRPAPRRKEFTMVFDSGKDTENRVIPQQIEALTHQIKQELAVLRERNSEFITEINEIEKQAMQTLPEKAGIYHVRFLELLLSLIKSISAKVGEAKTWLTAMQSKKAKRGSLFAARSKKQGTQYSLSQELQTTRSVM